MSRYAVRQADRVKEADPELFEQVKAGTMPLRAAQKEIARRDEATTKAVLDRVDPDGAVRQRQAELLAAWAKAHARLSHIVADLMSFDLDEVASLSDETQRYGMVVGIGQLRNYCSRLEQAMAKTATLQVIHGGRGR